MKLKLKTLSICILIPLLVGGLSALLTGNNMSIYQELTKPEIYPPGYIFPIVWTTLYILMGIASYIVLTSSNHQSDIYKALVVYGLQLFVNFLWPIFFFTFGWYLFSTIWIVLLLFLLRITMFLFYKLSKTAMYLMIPYLLWVVFAGYLNLSIYLLN